MFLNSVKKSINDGDEVILVGLSVGAAVALCLTIFIVGKSLKKFYCTFCNIGCPTRSNIIVAAVNR